MFERSLGIVLVTLSALGCQTPGDAPTPTSAATAVPSSSPLRAAAVCRPARGTKLGQPFVRICPDPTGPPGEAPFWIHASAVACSGGDHDVAVCAPSVSLDAAPEPTAGTRASRRTLLAEAFAAHRLCAMRFAGRLPTRAEQARARGALGLSSLAVVETSTSAGVHFDLRELPEWTTRVPCAQPTLLGAECEPAALPTSGASSLRWGALLRCDAERTVTTGLPVVAAGESCPAEAVTSENAFLPCAVGVRGSAAGTRLIGYRLRCGHAPSAPRGASEPRLPSLAAVRCVVPEALLDTRPE